MRNRTGQSEQGLTRFVWDRTRSTFATYGEVSTCELCGNVAEGASGTCEECAAVIVADFFEATADDLVGVTARRSVRS